MSHFTHSHRCELTDDKLLRTFSICHLEAFVYVYHKIFPNTHITLSYTQIYAYMPIFRVSHTLSLYISISGLTPQFARFDQSPKWQIRNVHRRVISAFAVLYDRNRIE